MKDWNNDEIIRPSGNGSFHGKAGRVGGRYRHRPRPCAGGAGEKVVDVNEGTIYPLLKRLTNERYFETYLRESTEGPPRKYYHLTAAGVLYRDTLEKEWNELTEKVGAFLEGCKNG